MQQHPFLVSSTSNSHNFPSQNLPSKKKDKRWKIENMDAIDWHAYNQFVQKQSLVKNYRMVNGELIIEDYIKTPDNEYSSLLDELGIKGGDPNKDDFQFKKHYDIISQPLSTLEGEMDNFPDVFNVIGRGDMIESERNKVKTQMLREWFMQQLENNLQQTISMDDPDAAMYGTEESQQQEPAMSPREIQIYMSNYRHMIEIWGQYELKDQFERFNIKALRREEFHHYLVSAERYRHIYKGPDGLKVKSENPLFVATHKSPTNKYTQYGDFASVVRILSTNAIIDEFGHLMTDKEINSLQEPYKKQSGEEPDVRFPGGKQVPYLSPFGIPYQTPVVSLDPNIRNFPSMGKFSNGAYYMTDIEASKVSGWENFDFNRGMLTVIQGYWVSQKRIGKLTWINPDTDQYEVIEVSDDFEVPDYIENIRDEKYNYIGKLNTIVWTRIKEIWQGIKICNFGSEGWLKEPLYLDIKPADIQIGRLPICGQFANNINTKPTSFVAKIEPFQVFYNMLMNEIFHFLITEWLPFLTVDTAILPKDKDWGGEDILDNWRQAGQEGTAAPVDTSPENLRGAQNSGGQFPRIIDMDRSTRIMTRLQLAAAIRQLALDQVGIAPQRLGQTKASETATGIQQATNSSYTQTSGIFSEFFECEREILQQQLDAAKYLQAQDQEYSVQTVKSDLSVETLRFTQEDGDLFDLHVYVTNSQEELRRLQLAQRLAIENNTSEIMMSDRLKMASSQSFNEIVAILKQSESEAIERNQQQIALQQQQLEQQGMSSQAALDQAQANFDKEQDIKLRIGAMQAIGRLQEADTNDNGMSDIFELYKLSNANQATMNQNTFNQEKLNIDKEKNAIDQAFKERELQDRDKQRRFEKEMKQLDLKRDQVRGDKSK